MYPSSRSQVSSVLEGLHTGKPYVLSTSDALGTPLSALSSLLELPSPHMAHTRHAILCYFGSQHARPQSSRVFEFKTSQGGATVEYCICLSLCPIM